MWTVFHLQWLRLKREPLLALTFLVLTVVFVFFLAGSQGAQTITIQTYSDELSEAEIDQWLEQLNQSEMFEFEYNDRSEVENLIRMSAISFALELGEDHYNYLVGQESHYLGAANQHVERVYRSQLRKEEVKQRFPDLVIEEQAFIEVDMQALTTNTSDNNEIVTHVITGMTLYFAMYTILLSMINLVTEKRAGTWNRLVFSPLKKTSIYLGQLTHYFCLGMIQIGISFYLFNHILDYNFGSQYVAIAVVLVAFVFAVVALGMLIMGLVQSPQQLQAVIPIVTTGMAMIGGAFWPLEIVSNDILLFLARLVPIQYGIEALKGAILYEQNVVELLQPISILLLMGVLFMGIGVNLIERTK
ncbi:ABC transporter permease [Amphibacillus jilinensis]|uniref:ABC transporter permease n=1 Tax=Amphibacillus jilinensis TaxID=1216008 RepID=UPI00030A6204|nr:ABC transporter permease [Amphibacillus jilinensis]